MSHPESPAFELLRERLRLHRPRPLPLPTRAAAVAVILRPTLDQGLAADAEVLLIERATRAGDPWSGHMALPGGKQDPGDPDLVATARREAHEEIGLELGPSLGRLSPVLTFDHRRRPLLVHPVAFRAPPAEPDTDPREVAAVAWARLSWLASPASRATRPWRVFGLELPAPGWRVGDRVVWGLTRLMLTDLLVVAGLRPRRPWLRWGP